MIYEIRSYEHSFLEDHVKIGSSIYNKWRMGGQTKLEQLEKAYSKIGFDPETRLYGFHNDKMIGFITCALIPKKENENKQKAHFEWPYVLQEHRECEKQLIEKAFEVLKNKGAEILVSRSGNYWGRSRDLAESYGFIYQNDIVRTTVIELGSFDPIKNVDHSKIQNFNAEAHGPAVIHWMMNSLNRTEEQAKASVTRLTNTIPGEKKLNPWDIEYHIVSNLVLIENGVLVGNAVISRNITYPPGEMVVMSLWSKDNNEDVEFKLLSRIKEDGSKMGYNKLVIHTGIWGFPDEVQEKWENRGYDFTRELAYYEKAL